MAVFRPYSDFGPGVAAGQRFAFAVLRTRGSRGTFHRVVKFVRRGLGVRSHHILILGEVLKKPQCRRKIWVFRPKILHKVLYIYVYIQQHPSYFDLSDKATFSLPNPVLGVKRSVPRNLFHLQYGTHA